MGVGKCPCAVRRDGAIGWRASDRNEGGRFKTRIVMFWFVGLEGISEPV